MIGLDTSVIVELEVQDAPNRKAAQALLKREVFDADETLGVSTQVIL